MIGTLDPTEPGSGLYSIHGGDVCPTSWHLSGARRNIITRVELQRGDVAGVPIDDVPFVYDDLVGQEIYGVEPYIAHDLICESLTDVNRIATRTFATRGYLTSPRVDRVTLDAATSDDALDLMTLASVFGPSRFRCRLELDRGVIFDEEMLAVGISESIRADGWTMELTLDSAVPWAATGGEWDQDRWDQTTWN